MSLHCILPIVLFSLTASAREIELSKAEIAEHEGAGRAAFQSFLDDQDGPDAARFREATRTHFEQALAALDQLIRDFPDQARWAAKKQEEVNALIFGLDRLTPLDDFDYYKHTTIGKGSAAPSVGEAAPDADSGGGAAAPAESPPARQPRPRGRPKEVYLEGAPVDRSRSGRIWMEASPGASVSLDQTVLGEVPESGVMLIIGLTPGTHAVEVALAGRQTSRTTVEIKGADIIRTMVTLAPSAGGSTEAGNEEPCEVKLARAALAREPIVSRMELLERSMVTTYHFAHSSCSISVPIAVEGDPDWADDPRAAADARCESVTSRCDATVRGLTREEARTSTVGDWFLARVSEYDAMRLRIGGGDAEALEDCKRAHTGLQRLRTQLLKSLKAALDQLTAIERHASGLLAEQGGYGGKAAGEVVNARARLMQIQWRPPGTTAGSK